MKVLIIGVGSEVEPLGIMYVIGALKSANHEVHLELIKNQVPFPDIPVRNEYDFVGFSILTGFHLNLFRLSEKYREAKIKTIIGGPHATFFPEECLSRADFVVCGEGVRSVLDIVAGKIKPGSVVRSEPVRNSDDIPFPDREELYKTPIKMENPIKNIMTSFGCPYGCAYCYNSLYNKMFPGVGIRVRSVDNVIIEAKGLLKYPLDLVFFGDDHFGLKMEWLREFAEKWPGEIGKPFFCQFRPEAATSERFTLLKKAGCTTVSMGIETFDEEYRKNRLNRHDANYHIYAASRLSKEFGFKLRTYMIIGLPGRTIENDLEDVRQSGIIQPDFVRVGMYIPLSGTVLGNYCIAEELWDGDDSRFVEMSMYGESVLNLSREYKKKSLWLQKISHAVYSLPYGHKVAKEFLEIESPTFDDFLRVLRKHMMDNFFEAKK